MLLISVIIPNYNCDKWISKTIESCLLQKEYIKEIIIVDDFSTDDSWDILKGYEANYSPLIRIFKNDVKGGNNARNYGYVMASGEYVQWLDADDQILENKFRDQLMAFDRHKDIDIVYSDWKLDTYSRDGLLLKEEKMSCKPGNDFLYELIINNWSAPHNYLLKREIADQLFDIKAWNPETKVGQDREYFTIAALLGARFFYTPGYYAVYNRWNKGSVSADVDSKQMESLDRMFDRFEDYLVAKKNLYQGKVERYQNALNTQRALLNVYGFPSKIRRGKLTILNAEWQIIHGFRTSIKFFLTVFFRTYQRSGD